MFQPKTYTPNDYRNYGVVRNIRELLSNIYNYRTLIKWLTRVGLTQQYKKSFLGITWLFISPMISVLLWLLLHYTGMFNPGETIVPYVAYVFLSSAIWNFFISFYKSISETYTGRGGELLQNNFPHVIIVIEKIIISVVNFGIPLLLSVFVLLIFNVKLSWTLLLFPFALIPLMLLGTALGLFFSVLKIVALDLSNFFDNALDILKYVTPIVFATSVNNSTLQLVMKYNPLTYLVNFPRSLLLNQGFPDLDIYLICSFFTFIFLLMAYRFFSISSPVVFEKITL